MSVSTSTHVPLLSPIDTNPQGTIVTFAQKEISVGMAVWPLGADMKVACDCSRRHLHFGGKMHHISVYLSYSNHPLTV